MTYNADKAMFQFDWKVAKNTATGTVQITVTVTDPDGTNTTRGLPSRAGERAARHGSRGSVAWRHQRRTGGSLPGGSVRRAVCG